MCINTFSSYTFKSVIHAHFKQYFEFLLSILTKFQLHNHLEGPSLTSNFTTVTQSPIYIQLNLLTSFVTSTLQQTFHSGCGIKLPLEMCKNDKVCSELHIKEEIRWSEVTCIRLSRKLKPEMHTVLMGRIKRFVNTTYLE